MCRQLTGSAHVSHWIKNLTNFFEKFWLESCCFPDLDLATNQKLSDKPLLHLSLARAPSECGRTKERVWFLHRCLPHPSQCDTPGTEVEARVTEKQLLRAQEELAILGSGGREVPSCHRLHITNTNRVEELLESPSFVLPVPVEVGAWLPFDGTLQREWTAHRLHTDSWPLMDNLSTSTCKKDKDLFREETPQGRQLSSTLEGPEMKYVQGNGGGGKTRGSKSGLKDTKTESHYCKWGERPVFIPATGRGKPAAKTLG